MRIAHTAQTEVEAVMLQGLLEAAGIPVVLASRQIPFSMGAVEPLYDFAPRGFADLIVPDDRTAEARDLIAAYLASLASDPASRADSAPSEEDGQA